MLPFGLELFYLTAVHNDWREWVMLTHLLLLKLSRGVWAMIAVFLAYCTLQAPSTWVIFPSSFLMESNIGALSAHRFFCHVALEPQLCCAYCGSGRQTTIGTRCQGIFTVCTCCKISVLISLTLQNIALQSIAIFSSHKSIIHQYRSMCWRFWTILIQCPGNFVTGYLLGPILLSGAWCMDWLSFTSSLLPFFFSRLSTYVVRSDTLLLASSPLVNDLINLGTSVRRAF